MTTFIFFIIFPSSIFCRDSKLYCFRSNAGKGKKEKYGIFYMLKNKEQCRKNAKTSERTKCESAGNGKGKQVRCGVQGVKGKSARESWETYITQ